MLNKYIDSQKQFCDEVDKLLHYNKISHAYLIETHGYYNCNELVTNFVIELYNSSTNAIIKVENKEELFLTGNYYEISPENMVIKKDAVISLKEKFMTKSLNSEYQIYVIFEADKLNIQAANSLLKFLEEPEANLIGILVTDNRYNLLETLRSRCQTFSLKEELIEFEIEDIEKISLIITTLERKKLEAIAYFPIILENEYLSKEKLLKILVNMQLIYNQALRKIEATNHSNSYIELIDLIIKNNKAEVILKKLDIIGEYIEKMKYNLNTNQVIDNFIIDFV